MDRFEFFVIGQINFFGFGFYDTVGNCFYTVDKNVYPNTIALRFF